MTIPKCGVSHLLFTHQTSHQEGITCTFPARNQGIDFISEINKGIQSVVSLNGTGYNFNDDGDRNRHRAVDNYWTKAKSLMLIVQEN